MVRIELNGLSKHYGSVKAVDELSLKIHQGEVFGLLGPNGAGKTTTILMMLGLVEPTSGKVRVCDLNPTHEPIEVKKKVAYMPDSLGFYDDMTALENLRYIANINGQSTSKMEEALAWVGLQEDKDKKTSTFSRGMKQRLGLADVLVRDPEVIIMDEPTLGIDPEGVRDFLQMIRKLSKEHGKTILLSSHHLHQVQQVCDRVGIFVKGKLLASGDLRELRKQLFGSDAIQVKIQSLQPAAPDLIEALKSVPAVSNVQARENVLMIECSDNICHELVKVCVQGNLSITGVSQEEQGLDEIYHQYFEKRK